MFCRECGRNIGEHRICPYCKALQSGKSASCEFTNIEPPTPPAKEEYGKRSYIVAGFLQLFLGAFGVGRFYLGFKLIGIFQIIATLLSFGMAGLLWGMADGFLILGGKFRRDAAGKLLI